MQYNKKYRWIYLMIFFISIRILLSFFPNVVEHVYSRGLFLVIRWFIDHTTARLPFPTLYIFIGIIGWLLFNTGIQWWQLFQQNKLKRLDLILPIANFMSITIVFFLLLWGFNYAREPLENQLHLETKKLNLEEIINETTVATLAANQARSIIPNADTNALSNNFLPPNLEDTMRQLLVKALTKYGYPTVGKTRCRVIYPKGLLMRLGASGIYLPWIGEGHVDGALTAAQIPFTIAHEMAHGYGFGDEGSCNFWGYVACMTSDNPTIRYSGTLAYWRYIASEYKYFQPEAYEVFRANNLSIGMKNDLELIYQNHEKYRNLIPYQDAAYDTYLKFQGVEEGIESYSRMVLLVKAWKSRK